MGLGSVLKTLATGGMSKLAGRGKLATIATGGMNKLARGKGLTAATGGLNKAASRARAFGKKRVLAGGRR